MAELLWSSPPPPLMLTQHLPAARGCCVLSRDPKCYSRINHNTELKLFTEDGVVGASQTSCWQNNITFHHNFPDVCQQQRSPLQPVQLKAPCIKVVGLYSKLLRRNKVSILINCSGWKYGLWHNVIAILAQLLRSMSKQPLLIDVQILEWVVTA